MRICLILLLILPTFILSQITDTRGKKQGYWKKKDDKNHLIYEGTFKDDIPVGKFIYYYPNDSVKAFMYFRNDGKTSFAKLLHPTGKKAAEGKYINKETRDSVWTFYDEAGTLLARETYRKGKKHGATFVYLPDGSLSEEKHYKDDIQHGLFIQYFDGRAMKSKGNFVNGQYEGRVAYYYPNGVEVAAGFYRNGLKNGAWIYKTQTGKIREKELYKNGNLAGPKETAEFFSKSEKPSGTPERKPTTAKKP